MSAKMDFITMVRAAMTADTRGHTDDAAAAALVGEIAFAFATMVGEAVEAAAAPSLMRAACSAALDIKPAAIEWRIAITDGPHPYHFSKYVNGVIDESYRHVDMSEALTWGDAIIRGFQPPPYPVSRDKPVG